MELGEKVFTYLKSKIEGFEKTTKNRAFLFSCPRVLTHHKYDKSPSATFIAGSDKISCLRCGFKGTFFDAVRHLEPEKANQSDSEIIAYLISELDVDIYSELNAYVNYGWALVPIAKNSKNPIEKDWTNIAHKDKVDWIKWLNNGLNLGCFDDKTQILTRQGWKYFKDLDKKDEVATLNPHTEELEYEIPLSYINTSYSGEMYHIQSNTFDCFITPNHRVYFKTVRSKTSKGNKYIQRIDQIYKKYDRIEIPITCNWKGDEIKYFELPLIENFHLIREQISKIDIVDWLSFLGWYLSEGSCTNDKGNYTIVIHQYKQENRKLIRELLRRLPFHFNEYEGKFVILSKQLFTYLKQFGHAENKFIPEDIKKLSPRLLNYIYNTLILGDGHKTKSTEIYYTVSKHLAEDVQEIMFKLGFASYIFKKEPQIHKFHDRFIKGNFESFAVIKQKRRFRTIKQKNIKKTNYIGNIYCVETFNGLIYVKRNEHCYWSGNSRTGEVSGITVIDVDFQKTEDNQEASLLLANLIGTETLMQNSPHGTHYVFKYDKDIPQTVNIAGLHIDVRNDGGQILVQPSKIDTLNYHWKNLGNDIKIIPENVKAKLLELLKVDLGRENKMSKDLPQEKLEPIKLKNNNLEGQCNDTFVQLGGALIKKFTPDQTEFILYLLNNNLLENPMPSKSIKAMVGSLEGYAETEIMTQEKQIYECLQILKCDIDAKTVVNHTNLKHNIINKYLAKLENEGILVRKGRGLYDFKDKIAWTHGAEEDTAVYPYKVPFFGDIANFHQGDIILLGGLSGHGKTHQAMNIIREIVAQGVKPYYFSFESGSRFKSIADKLGLKSTDFYVPKDRISNPTVVSFEQNAFTIIDWIYLGDDFAATPKIFNHLKEEMRKAGGILIVFTQLQKNYDWYAKNMIEDFVSLSARYIFDDEDTGKFGHWDVSKIRDPKGNFLKYTIACEYDPETKIFKAKGLV